jgi:hypothetical protein
MGRSVEGRQGEARMRRTGLPAGRLALALVVGLVLAGCATPEYRFVGNAERDLVIRMPRSWTPLETTAALKASGIDPATSNSSWTAFYDAAPKPVVAHVQSISTDDPFMFAQSIPVSAEQRASITVDKLRELILPGTPEVREQATKAKDFAILTDEVVSKRKQQGVHLRYSFKIGETTELYERIALTDPKHTAIHILFVHCTQKCFAAHPEIDDVVTSLTLKSH